MGPEGVERAIGKPSPASAEGNGISVNRGGNKMRNYATPEIEVVSADALDVLTISIGDVDVNVGDGFF